MPAEEPASLLTRRAFMAACALGLASAQPPAQAALPLPLAREAALDIDPAGYLVSEKYDGVRAVWDGRQLRFRSGLPVPAPDWFCARLPATPLDGELWLARGQFERLSGIVRRQHADDAEWQQLRYLVFELPQGDGGFALRAGRIEAIVRDMAWPQLQAVAQQPLADRSALRRRFDAVVAGGGEGLVLHRADALYATDRSAGLLKLKPLHDAEALVIGHEAGRGRHAGRLGALRVRNDEGVEFLVGTGFSDAQRSDPPPLGSRITYSHRGTTAGGVPRFASFLRLRDV